MIIPYALVINPEGYVSEIKMSQVDTDNLPIVGQPIVDIHGATFEFYNLCGYQNKKDKYCLIENGELKTVSKKDSVPRLKELVKLFVQCAENAHSVYMTHKRGTDLSELEVIVLALKKGMSIKYVSTPDTFSEARYKEIHNELVMYNNIMETPIYNFINNLIYGVNTILAVERKITPSPTSLFCYAGYEKEGMFLNFKAATECIAEMLDRGHVLRKPRR